MARQGLARLGLAGKENPYKTCVSAHVFCVKAWKHHNALSIEPGAVIGRYVRR